MVLLQPNWSWWWSIVSQSVQLKILDCCLQGQGHSECFRIFCVQVKKLCCDAQSAAATMWYCWRQGQSTLTHHWPLPSHQTMRTATPLFESRALSECLSNNDYEWCGSVYSSPQTGLCMDVMMIETRSLANLSWILRLYFVNRNGVRERKKKSEGGKSHKTWEEM